MRILITGSRTWTDRDAILEALTRFVADSTEFRDDPVTIVHGACPAGADSIADSIARNIGWHVERWPADWQRHGRRAGFVRNAEMVGAGATVCLAFIDKASRGATMCADLAEKAGIPVVRYARN